MSEYAEAGIPDDWIVNLNDSLMDVYRDRERGAYRSKTVDSDAGKGPNPLAAPTVLLDPARLF